MIHVFSINVTLYTDDQERAEWLANEAQGRVEELVGVLEADASTPINVDPYAAAGLNK